MASNVLYRRQRLTSILLSVKPEYASAILSGEKRFEFRRTVHRSLDVDVALIYASSPKRKIVGGFRIAQVHSMEPRALWRHTRDYAGVDWSFFEHYFAGREVGYALEVGEYWEYLPPLELEEALGIDQPPQSFRYLEESNLGRAAILQVLRKASANSS